MEPPPRETDIWSPSEQLTSLSSYIATHLELALLQNRMILDTKCLLQNISM